MADNGALYAIIGGLAVAVAGAGLYIAHQHGAFDRARPRPFARASPALDSTARRRDYPAAAAGR